MNRALLVAVLLLAACAGPRPGPGAGAAGDDAAAERASCRRSCDRAHAVCGDSSAAGRAQGPFSGSATCDRQLRQCLAACDASGAPPASRTPAPAQRPSP
jgi:hypothetical protein